MVCVSAPYLRLNLGEPPTAADWEALIDTDEEFWLTGAIERLGTWPEVKLFEGNHRALDAILTPRHWRARRLLTVLAAEVSSGHASGLADPELWSSLGLFARPGRAG